MGSAVPMLRSWWIVDSTRVTVWPAMSVMTYAVKELFFTLQGEGAQSGRAAVFLRFAGCNLWSGRNEDRARGPGGCARWCDTDFVGTNGANGGRYDARTLATRARALWEHGVLDRSSARPFIVCTGGEPALQLDEALIEALHQEGFEVAIETNGTRVLPRGIDWVCVSPKAGAPLVVTEGDELKLVYPQGTEDTDPRRFEALSFRYWFVQPLDEAPSITGLDGSVRTDEARMRAAQAAREANTKACIALCLARPRWRLSLQMHKLVGIP
jgi:7-carboxy-7-deazaguanine synthase (Cx14CxxC type)